MTTNFGKIQEHLETLEEQIEDFGPPFFRFLASFGLFLSLGIFSPPYFPKGVTIMADSVGAILLVHA